MERKIANVAVVGCGNISAIYLENLTKLFRNVRVAAVSDLVPEKAQAAAEKYHAEKILTLEQVLADESIDIVLNITTPPTHFDICRRALEAGKSVYVEKPLSLRPEEGAALVKLAAEKGLYLGCAPDTFLGAGIQTCVKLIGDGFIGEPVAASAFMTCHGHESWHPDPEFYYKRGGGPMFDMGPYYLTALVAMLGPAESVCGMTKISFPQRTITSAKKYGQVIGVEVPTHVTGSIRFRSGAIATMITSFDVWQSSLPRIEIYGTLGTLTVPDPNTFGGPVMLRGKEIPMMHIYEENSRGLGLAEMARSMQEGRKNRACGELGCHVLEIMHAFHESSDTGRYYTMKTTCEKPRPMPLGLVRGEVE